MQEVIPPPAFREVTMQDIEKLLESHSLKWHQKREESLEWMRRGCPNIALLLQRQLKTVP